MEIYWKKATLLAKEEGSSGMSFIAKSSDGVYISIRIMRGNVGQQFQPIVFEYETAEELWEALKPRSNKIGGGASMALLWKASDLDDDLRKVLISRLTDYL